MKGEDDKQRDERGRWWIKGKIISKGIKGKMIRWYMKGEDDKMIKWKMIRWYMKGEDDKMMYERGRW